MLSLTSLRHKLVMQIPAAVLTLGMMWFFPFLVHFFPAISAVPLGSQLLPIFYAPLLAAWLFNPFVGLACSLLMPFINHALTGLPEMNVAVMLSIELSVFSLALMVFRKSGARLPVFAPLALIVAKVFSSLVLFILPIMPVTPWAYFTSSLITAIPGLIILFVINFALLGLPDER